MNIFNEGEIGIIKHNYNKLERYIYRRLFEKHQEKKKMFGYFKTSFNFYDISFFTD